MEKIKILSVEMSDDSIDITMNKNTELVMEALANGAMMDFSDGDAKLLSLWVGVVMRALACDMTGKLQERTMKFMEMQIPILRASLQLQQERMNKD